MQAYVAFAASLVVATMADTKWRINKDKPVNASQGSNVVMAQTSDQTHTMHIYSTIDSLALITLEFDAKVDFDSASVNWTAIMEKRYDQAITSKATVIDRSVLVLPALVELNDTAGTMDYTNATVHRQLRFNQTSSWSNASLTDQGMLLNYTDALSNCSIQFTLVPKATDGRVAKTPALTYTSNSTVVSLLASNCSATVTKSRWSLPMLLYSGTDKTTSFAVKQSIDDEYSPSVFKVSSYRAKSSTTSNYVSWKPVVFGSNKRSMTNMTATTTPSLVEVSLTTNITNTSAAGLMPSRGFRVMRSVVIFGVTGDKLYNQTTVSFSLVAGLGEPGNAKFSTALVATLAASLGVPVLAFVGGGLFVTYKRCTGPASEGYNSIN
eukprot:m.101781 g.101781  ORF g.101781 m.101781 type:complete len:380 (-) comp15184_c0_seq1:1753-2892(-)